MARPIAGDPPAGGPPAPAAPHGAPIPPSPFSYTNQPSLPGPAVSSAPTPAGLWNAFRRRWVLGTFVGALAAAAAAVGIWTALPAGKHQARAWVQLRPKAGEFLSRSQEDFAAYRDQQRFLLRNRDLLTQALADPAVASLDLVKQSDDPVQMLEDGLRVSVAAPEILEVTLTGNQLDDMRVVLEHLMKRYVGGAIAIDNKQRDDHKDSLEKQKAEVDREIDLREKALELLSRSNGSPNSEGTAIAVAMLRQQFQEAERLFNDTRRQKVSLENEREVIKAQLAASGPNAAPDDAVVRQRVNADPQVQRARAAVKALKDHLEEQEKLAAEGAVVIKEIKENLAKLEKQAAAAEKASAEEARESLRAAGAAEARARLASLEREIEIKRREQDSRASERDTALKVIEGTAGGGATIEAQRKALDPLREVSSQLHKQILATRLQGDAPRVSQRGSVEKVPNNNQNKKIVMSSAGGLAAFMGVVLLVSLLEWRTRRVDGVDQVVTELGMRVIGTVPLFPNRASIRAAVEAGGANWRFVLNESINSTRTMLLHAARSQSMQVVMVTSATQGEGKTSITSQLASSMATAGMRTLIVDCDLRNPSIMKLFELPLTPGVSEVLRGEVDASDAVQATAVPNLWVIPAGQCSNATIAALAQGHPLETLFNRLRGQFDFVIVDSCPVLPVADALLVAQHVDGVVFSIMQDISELPKVITASEKLGQLNIPLVGAVVNGIKQDVYSYGYNYVKQLPA